jgi:hypothetical protein
MMMHYGAPAPLTFTMQLTQLVECVHHLTAGKNIGILTKFETTYIAAYNGHVSTTPSQDDKDIWRLEAASHAIVSIIQNPNKIFEAMTHSVLD